jgi:hypothetical protein
MFKTGLFQLYVHFCCREEKGEKWQKGRWTATFYVTESEKEKRVKIKEIEKRNNKGRSALLSYCECKQKGHFFPFESLVRSTSSLS